MGALLRTAGWSGRSSFNSAVAALAMAPNLTRCAMHEIQGMTLFFGAEDALSNWHPARFTFRGVEFTSVEQFMMYSKARLFDDDETARQILSASQPREQKRLGRQ